VRDDNIGQGDDGLSGRPVSPSGGGTPESAGITTRMDGGSGSNVITLHVPGPNGAPTETVATLGRFGFNNHSASICTISPANSDARMVSAAWIESAIGDTSGLGRVMWQRFDTHTAANDNAVWATRADGTGAIGCEPLIAELTSGETLLTWVDADGHAHGKLYAPDHDDAPPGDAAGYAAVNASLADLGATAPAPDGNRRLQVIEQRPGNLAVMWLALADSGYVLRGSIFSTPQDASAAGDAKDVPTPVADIRLPSGFTGQFSLQRAADGSAEVAYGTGSQASSVVVTLRRADAPQAVSDLGHLNGAGIAETDWSAGPHATTSLVAAARDASSDGVAKTGFADAPFHVNGAAPLPLILHIGSTAISDPIVTALRDGFAVAWEEPGATEKAVAIKLALFDKQGSLQVLADGSTTITVTDNALKTVAPAIAHIGSGVGVSYVDASKGALTLEAFDGTGQQIGQEIVVDNGSDGAISDIAMASNGDQNDDLAIVYVRDDHDDQEDYGSIMVQRFRAQDTDADGATDELAAVGSDGQANGDDAPTGLTTTQASEDGSVATQDVHGRAPAVAGLEDGDIAIVWVENDGAGETIKGCVLEADGSQVLRIDLTGLLQDGGIVKGTEPILIANEDGDILVSWLQRDGTGGDYVVMAAVYDSTGVGQWTAPQEPVQLQTFDEMPKDFYVAWADDNGHAIDLSWRADSSGSGSGGTFTQRFDLDGNDLSHATKIYGGNDLDNDSASTAGLVDGQIVVVYTEESRNGDLDLTAQVIDANTGDTNTVDIAKHVESSLLGGSNDQAISLSRLSTGVDQEVTLNVLETAPGATVSHINGEPITAAEPVDVGSAWVQLREDGWLTISPNAGYEGDIAFDYTISDGTGGTALTSRVKISVEDEHGKDGEQGIKLADLDLSDGEVSTEGLTAAGLDADMFKIVGNTLYLKAGLDFDFDTNPSLTIEVRSHDGPQPDSAVNFTLNVADSSGSGNIESHLVADTFVFAPGFGDSSGPGEGTHETIDMSSSPYSTFQELLDSGALVQAGHDVVITLDPTDPDHSDKITLRGMELSALTSADFKF
jgi:hypothetical protein